MTNPALRGKGYGPKIVKNVIQRSEIAHLKKLEAFITPEKYPHSTNNFPKRIFFALPLSPPFHSRV